jgi:TRAP-type mannitol/chloroaromatic compound transport system permease small subunit
MAALPQRQAEPRWPGPHGIDCHAPGWLVLPQVGPGSFGVRRLFLSFATALDGMTRAACMAAGIVLVCAVLAVVVLRYGFGMGFIGLQDLASYAFAVFLILSVPVCMAQGGHVRVEVFSERLPQAYLRWADRVALVLFLIPVFALVLWAYWPELLYSWSIREASVETGGLKGLFLVKTTLPAAAALMIVQGLAAVLRAAEAGKPAEAAPGL